MNDRLINGQPLNEMTTRARWSKAAHLRQLLDAKADLMESAAQITEARGLAGSSAELADNLTAYYHWVSPEDLTVREPEDILGAYASHRRLAAQRVPGRASVRVYTPSVENNGWSCGHTVVEVVTDDMPFLVDSVMGALTVGGHGIHLLVHPMLHVRRTADGELAGVITDGDRGENDLVESWIHVEIDRLPDAAAHEALAARLAQVLDDVRVCVEDWPRMRHQAVQLANQLLHAQPVGVPYDDVQDAMDLLRWLADDNFTFLGYRQYQLRGEVGAERLDTVPGTGLGILRQDKPASTAFSQLSADARARARLPILLIVTKANSRSTIHRPAYLDYIGIKQFAADGTVIGEYRFLGLFSADAYTQSVRNIPALDRKVEEVFARVGVEPNSHDGKDLMQFLETYPRDELFQISADELAELALEVAHIQERRRTRLFLRRDPYGRFISCLVYLPRDRYTTTVREAMQDVLLEAFEGEGVEYTARVSESVLARLHFIVRRGPGRPDPHIDINVLEQRLSEATRSWDDDLIDALYESLEEDRAALLAKDYHEAFAPGYKEDFSARGAVADIRQIEDLGADGLAVSFYEPLGGALDERRFKMYSTKPISLAKVLPVLHNMGVEVTDERPYEIDRLGQRVWIFDFGMRIDAGSVVDPDGLKQRFEATFAAVWAGRAESDGLNALVIVAGMGWRDIIILRAYLRYLRQAGTTFSSRYIEAVVVEQHLISAELVKLFHVRFDPGFTGDRDTLSDEVVSEVHAQLDTVASLDHDRILRSFLGMILASLRTNFFQDGGASDEAGRPTLAIKLNPQEIPELPQPRPHAEIWVYSPRVEGVHLRFGKVARGGLRWSDRPEDFRTEILGLVKAQAVKNSVIVPVGAKGGFFARQLPDQAMDRDAWMAEGVASYRLFIASLLDITDNLIAGEVVPPADVVRHDGDDPYLVVAADKGTATFSDIANGIASEYGFWLGDAFASGGSAGYDHKAMGITARGAWESVKRHFRELGVNTQTEDFTVVGVGDMSGDVFGNGMLLSEHIRLIAAFDHRHIFIDPEPVADVSFSERKRLFGLPRSSWADYDASLISAGGGVYPRSAKAIPVTPEAARALGLSEHEGTLTPAEYLKAILKAPVDLLWNGGIGTYVKSSAESHAEVGDKANDAIRIDGADLGVRVVGEGGNLGFTQRGRIEAAIAGVRLNSDAIDNSAGVDTSDHEVNIKILLDSLVRDGDLTEKQRKALLVEMTDPVAEHVLRDNYEQNVQLGNARSQNVAMLSVHRRLILSEEAAGRLDRELEFLPSEAELDRRHAVGAGLYGPELSVLMAYAKMGLEEDLLLTTVPDEEWAQAVLGSYFPPQIVSRYPAALPQHPLKREIITTVLANEVVNRGGSTFVLRAIEESGAGIPEVVRAFIVSREVFGLPQLWRRIEELDNQVPTRVQSALSLEVRRLLDRATRWFLQSRGSSLDVKLEIERFRDPIAELSPKTASLLRGVESERLRKRAEEFVALGAPQELALEVAGLLDVYSLLDIVEVSLTHDADPIDVGALYFSLSERYEVDRMLGRITGLPRDDRWSALARAALRSDLYGVLAGLTSRVIAVTPEGGTPEDRIREWESRFRDGLTRARGTLSEISKLESQDLATLSVALRVMRTLVAQG